MKKSQSIAVTIAIIAVLWIGSGVVLSPPQPEDHHNITEDNQKEHPLAEVRVRDIKAEDFSYDIIITGRSAADAKVDIKAEVEGPIITIKADKGDPVKKGDLLAEIEIQDRAARVKEARQLLNQRRTEYNAAKTLNQKGFNSDIRLAEKRALMEAAQSALAEAQNTLDKTRIKAPFDGVINDRALDEGALANMGETLFTLVDLDPIKITGFVAEREIGAIKTGVTATALMLDGTEHEGPVTFIALAADPDTRTFKIEMEIPNTDFSIQDGLTAKMRIPVAARKAHKISPSVLSLNDEGKIGVKIVNDQDIVIFKPITILSDKTDMMWIDGLPDNTRLITVGQEFVKDGQHVKPVLSKGNGLL
ncbi:MAG: hypothetical protein CMH27_08175 [Micavibrio sp.]|nr:hypothetical protein [Micavibrio sp.]